MGPTVVDGGVFFRVWAPAATAVHVCGDFNQWSHDASPLEPEGGGVWGGRMEGARPGDQYKLRLTCGEQVLERHDPYARAVTSSNGNSVLVSPSFEWGDDRPVKPAFNEMILYELHIGTFHTKEPGRPGTFVEAQEKLGHLAELGVNAIEVMPLAECPGQFSWGYNPSNPFAVSSVYGGPDAFRRLVAAAHRVGIGVIADVVYNHFGPSDLDLWRFDGWGEGEGGGIFFYNDHRAWTPWGMTRPDYSRPEVRRYVRDNALMWLEEYRVDGLRCDGPMFIRSISDEEKPEEALPDGRSLLQELTREVNERFPGQIFIAEYLCGDHAATRPRSEGGEGFHAQWDARFDHTVRRALVAPKDEERSMQSLCDVLLDRYNGDPFQRVIYTESHDAVANGRTRVTAEIDPQDHGSYLARKRAALGLVMVMTAPGIPMIFQGQELFAGESFEDTRPLDWSALESAPPGVSLLRDLIRLRRDLSKVTRGLLGPHVAPLRVDDEHKALVYHRWMEGGAGDSVVVALNFSAQPLEGRVGLPGPGRWEVRFNSGWSGYFSQDQGELAALDATPQEHDGQPFSAPLRVLPYSAVVLSVTPPAPASAAPSTPPG